MYKDYLSILSQTKYDNFLAHLREDGQETLYEHTKMVCDYGDLLTEKNHLHAVLDALISDLLSKDFEQTSLARDFFKTMFFDTLKYHDLGKINPNFQHVKMQRKDVHQVHLSFGVIILK